MFSEFLQSGVFVCPDPDTVWMGWGDWQFQGRFEMAESEAELASRPLFYVPEFIIEHARYWIKPSRYLEIPRAEFTAGLRAFLDGAIASGMTTPAWEFEAPSKPAFSADFGMIRELQREGVLDKAVPVVFEQTTRLPQPLELGRMLLSIFDRSGTTSRPYGFWRENEGMLGATPETLFSVTPDGELTTMALAGTYSKDRRPEDLLHDLKERREHQIVVDFILEALSKLGEPRAEPIRVLELPRMYHLYTPISVKLRPGYSYPDLVAALHPTPALGVWPRVGGGMRWLAEQSEREDRGRFGAAFGAEWNGRGISLVAIRNLQWNSRRSRIGSGCGVVAGSRLDSEWAELALKRASVREMLGL